MCQNSKTAADGTFFFSPQKNISESLSQIDLPAPKHSVFYQFSFENRTREESLLLRYRILGSDVSSERENFLFDVHFSFFGAKKMFDLPVAARIGIVRAFRRRRFRLSLMSPDNLTFPAGIFPRVGMFWCRTQRDV